MNDDINDIIIDHTVGDVAHWKSQLNNVLEDIKTHSPELLVSACFCDISNSFNAYRRCKEIYIDIHDLMEYLEPSEFKAKLIHNVLDILFDMGHPLYYVIEIEVRRM